MSTNYPNSIDNFGADRTDNTNTKIPAADINNPRHAIIAIETELGANVKGSDASVKARLDRIDTGTGVTNASNADKLDNYHANTGAVANTIPVRDANGLIPGIGTSTGTYTGDGTASRSINVGMGRQPKEVIVYPLSPIVGSTKLICRITPSIVGVIGNNGANIITAVGTGTANVSSGVALNSTGFVTGSTVSDANSLNQNGQVYYWTVHI